MAKIIYAPFGIALGLIGGLLGRKAFDQVWKGLTGESDAPGPREHEYSWKQVIGAAALQGAIFAAIKAIVDRGGAKGFQKLTGFWPGD